MRMTRFPSDGFKGHLPGMDAKPATTSRTLSGVRPTRHSWYLMSLTVPTRIGVSTSSRNASQLKPEQGNRGCAATWEIRSAGLAGDAAGVSHPAQPAGGVIDRILAIGGYADVWCDAVGVHRIAGQAERAGRGPKQREAS